MSGGCGTVVNPSGFTTVPQLERGGKGGGDFLFKAPEGPLFGSPFPPFPPAGGLCRSGFSFCYFFFWR